MITTGNGVPPHAWVFLAIFAAVEEAATDGRGEPLIQEICEKFHFFRTQGISLGISLSSVPGEGYDSFEVRRKAKEYCACGLAVKNNPLTFTEKGMAVLRAEFERDLKKYGSEFERVARLVGLI